MKKILKGLIILTLLVGMMPMEAAAASKNVRVTLPDFAVDQFGWKFSFDPQNGLKIRSSNPQLQKNTLLNYAQGDVVEAEGYYYYGGSKGEIFQAPMANLKEIKKVYQLPIYDYGDGKSYVYYSLYKKDGQVWLKYHQGGALMGSDFYIRLKKDGMAEQAEYGYLTLKTFGDITLKVNQGVPPGPCNLAIKYTGNEYESLGEPVYMYGWIWKKDQYGESGGPSDDLYLIGRDVYILGFNTLKDTDKSRVHKVNIDTNETVRVSELTAQFFKIDQGYIYISSEGTLYQMPLDGGTEEKIAGDSGQFEVLNGKVYYTNSRNNGLYEAVSKQSINPGAKVTGIKVDGDCLICTFKEEASNPYRLIVIDKNGKIIFKTSDVASINNVTIEKGKIYYLEDTSHNVYITDLPE